MMMRLMLVIGLLIGLTMPCASGEEASTKSSPLSKVTIDAEDWVEGDMYHIRYTFTNPTDEMIDKEIDFTTIGYHYYNYDYKHNDSSTIQYDETLSRLTIAPHSSYTTTVSLKQPLPSIFNQLIHSNFYFKDSSYLYYSIASEAPKSLFSLLPNVSPTGDVFLTIQNNSPTETINELRNILINTEIQGKHLYLLRAKPYPLYINPNETIQIPIFRLDNTTDKNSSYSSYYITADINGIPHRYNIWMSDSRILMGSNDTFEIRFDSHYSHATRPQIDKDSSFCLDESNLYAYIQINSRNKNKTISVPNTSYLIHLTYFDQNMHSQSRNVYVYLPPDFCLNTNETKYFTFNIPLPPDFGRLNPHTPIYCISQHPDLSSTALFPLSKLATPVPKEQYTFLNNVSIIVPPPLGTIQ